ncbi:hypothetical protein F220043C3_32380 [Enterocloster asparagiformis]
MWRKKQHLGEPAGLAAGSRCFLYRLLSYLPVGNMFTGAYSVSYGQSTIPPKSYTFWYPI